MGTRSFISAKIGDKYKGISVHWDGYISGGVGECLIDHYQNFNKIKELISYGSRSSLEAEPDDGGIYPEDEQRDYTFDNLDELVKFAEEHYAEYIYVYEDRHWKVIDSYLKNHEFVDLKAQLKAENEESEDTKDSSENIQSDNTSDNQDKLDLILEKLEKIEKLLEKIDER